MENFLLSVVLFILIFSVLIWVFKQPLPSTDSRSSSLPKIPPEPLLNKEKTAISSPPLPQPTPIEETPATVASIPPAKLTVTEAKPAVSPSFLESIPVNTSNVSPINLNSPAQLRDYLAHPDSAIRVSVATQLGNQMAETPVRAETMPAIASLGRLSQDSDSLVRQSAVIALGKISSEKVIPFLKKALRDADSDVVKGASAAIDKYKGYRLRSLKSPTQKVAKRLPKSTL